MYLHRAYCLTQFFFIVSAKAVQRGLGTPIYWIIIDLFVFVRIFIHRHLYLSICTLYVYLYVHLMFFPKTFPNTSSSTSPNTSFGTPLRAPLRTPLCEHRPLVGQTVLEPRYAQIGPFWKIEKFENDMFLKKLKHAPLV